MITAGFQAPFADARRFVCSWSVLFAVVVAIILPSEATSADPEPPTRSITPIPVNSDRPDTWPDGDWVPIRGQMLKDLLERSQAKPQQPRKTWIERATYTATFDGSNLRGGRLTADIRHDSKQAELLSLEPLNLAVSEMSWTDKPAIWGTLGDGRTALLVDGKHTALVGRWNLTGRKLPRSVEFDVQIPSAAVSRIHLTLPEGFVVSASIGESRRIDGNGNGELDEWELELGSQTRCRITIRRRPDRAAARPLVLVESNHSYVVREDGIQLQAEFHLETVNAPVNLLVFNIPAGVNVYSVSYGSNSSLTWRLIPDGENFQLAVQLSDPLFGSSRPFRIAGTALSTLERMWQLPQPRLKAALSTTASLRNIKDEFFTGDQSKGLGNAVFLSGNLHLKVESPLELQSIDSRGFRQTATVSTPDVASSLSFQQYLPDAQLRLEVAYPELRRDVTVLTYVDTSGENWSMTAHVTLSTHAGKTFEAECRLAPTWEVIEVRSRDDESALTNWEVRPQKGGGRTLSLEFREAIAPGSPKSVEVVARRLPLPQSRPLRLPLLRPLQHGSAEQLIAVSHSAVAIRNLQSDSGFRIVQPGAAPAFATDSDLWQRIESSSNGSTLLLHSRNVSGEGLLRLEQLGPAIDGHIWITHTLDSAGLTERVQVRISPKSEAIDHLNVYLTVSGGDVEWNLNSSLQAPLNATRISIDQHSDWDLPPGGELWEIHLPQPLRREFVIVGTRTRNAAASMMPTLAVVPGLDPLGGIVELQSGDGLNVDTQIDGLIAVEAGSIDRQEFPDATKRQSFGRLWRFQSARESLLLRLREGADGSPRRRTATMTLQSILSDEFPGFDRHRATLTFLGGGQSDAFRFELPRPAVLLSASLNGVLIAPQRRGSEWVVPLASGGGRSIVQLEYQTPSAGGRLGQTRTIPVPQCMDTILEFNWEFATGPDVWVVREPDDMLLLDRLSQLSWTERFFGPLGRPIDRAMFNPFSAKSWAAFRAAESDIPGHNKQTTAGDFSPAGWTVHRATAPYLPGELTISTRRHSQAWLLAWLGTLGCLLGGLLIRVRNSTIRKGVFGYWLSSCLFAAWLSPPFYALIAGGCVVGTVVALLFPRRLLDKLRFQKSPEDLVPMGSTASYRAAPATALLLIAALTAVQSFAQDEPARNAVRSGGEAIVQSGAPPEESIRVLVRKADGNPSVRDEEIVYVERDTLSQLRLRANRANDAESYLVSAANYIARVDEQNSVVVEAKYKVYLLPGVRKARVAFPNARANPSRCQVNERPQPVVLGKDGQQFFVNLNSTSDDSPPNDSLPDAVSEFDVSIEFRPATDVAPGGDGYQLNVIAVASAHLQQEFSLAPGTIELNGARGEQIVAADHRSLSVLLGKTSRFQVLWSKNVEPVQAPARLEAAITTHVTARPTWLELRYHVDYRILSGQIDFVAWKLPHAFDNMVVREVTLDGEPVDDVSVVASTKSTSKLVVQFTDSQQRDFTVDALVIVPVTMSGNGEIRVPTASLVEASAQPYAIFETHNLLGIATPPEFDITPLAATANGEGPQEIATESSVTLAGDSGSVRPVEYAYEVNRAELRLPFMLKPAGALRTVRMIQTGVVRGDVLQWTLTADLETSRAPVFRHRLRVPPQLVIAEISVREDDAERLVHWSRRGNFVELFLSDKSTGIQSISLKGERRLPRATPVALPLIEFEQAEITKTWLRIFYEPPSAVQLLESDALDAIETGIAPSIGEGELELLGQYRLNTDERPPRIQVNPNGDPMQTDAIVSIAHRASGEWQVIYDFQFRSTNNGRPINRVRLQIPKRLVDHYRVQSPLANLSREEQADGSVQLSCVAKSMPANFLRVRIIATLDTPPPGDWTLPQIDVADVNTFDRYLLISRELGLQPAGRSIDRVLPRALPVWVRHRAELGSAGDKWSAYIVESPDISFFVGLTESEPETSRIPLVETRIVLSGDDEAFGQTTIWIAHLAVDEFELAWPRELTVRAVFVDRESAVVIHRDVTANSLSIPIATGTGPHRIDVHWSQPAVKTLSRWSPRLQPIPTPRTIDVERSIVTMVPPENVFYTARDQLEKIEAFDYALDKLQTLHEMNESQGNGRHRPPLWNLLLRQQRMIENQLSHSGQATSASSLWKARRERFERISQGIAAIQTRLPQDGPVREAQTNDWPVAVGESMTIVVAPNRSALLGRMLQSESQSLPSISFWIVENWVVAAILLLIALPLIPVVRRLVKLDIGGWLSRHQPAAWALLGLLWWTCLRPSELGIVLLLVSLVVAVWDRRRSAEDSDFVVNISTDESSGTATNSR
jgi:hypothetical protein